MGIGQNRSNTLFRGKQTKRRARAAVVGAVPLSWCHDLQLAKYIRHDDMTYSISQ